MSNHSRRLLPRALFLLIATSLSQVALAAQPDFDVCNDLSLSSKATGVCMAAVAAGCNERSENKGCHNLEAAFLAEAGPGVAPPWLGDECGPTFCSTSEYCCNRSCGYCRLPGLGCTVEACLP